MEKNFEMELNEIVKTLQKDAGSNPLRDVHNYNDEMTISQVVKFFSRQGVSLTKTMIQNYVRVGVLPSPAEKRYYKREHLIMLTLIDRFKSIYSLDEIRRSYMDDTDGDMGQFYENYLEIYESVTANMEETLAEELKYLEGLSEDKENIKALLLLMLMTRSASIKRMVEMVLEK